MARSSNIPYIGTPPEQYSRPYFAELARSFALLTQQLNTPGPWRTTELTLTQQLGNVDRGQLKWNENTEEVDITLGNGVIQQVGFDTYMRCTNSTFDTIPKGTVVGFDGALFEIFAAPYIADNSANELYFIGVAARDLPPEEAGPVKLYGRLEGIDTTGQGGETWNIGDILYASPTTAGALTNVRPTAPNVVIAIAAVLVVDSQNGALMVRPTIPIGLDYGSFDSTTDQTLAAINTATAVTMSNTLSSNGVSLVSGSRLTVAQSGFYEINAVFQLTSGNTSAKNVYFWLRKNGVDVPETTRAITVNINNGFVPISLSYTLSLAEGEYAELYWAANDTNVTLDALAASAFAPAAPSVLVNISQLQL